MCTGCGRPARVLSTTASTRRPEVDVPATPTILATSGGFTRNERNNLAPAGLVRLALRTSAADRPKLCFLGTATGDDVGNVQRIYAAFSGWSVDVSHLQLFTMPNVADVRSHLLGQDVIWVGGGSVANLLAVWRGEGGGGGGGGGRGDGGGVFWVSSGPVCLVT